MTELMTNVLTNTGLNLPEHFTEGEFFEAGQFLANIEHGLQWAVGDWYNAIPDSYGDKKAACEKAGLDYKAANTYAKVASSFESPTRVGCLSFAHHQKLAIDALDDSQRTELLRKAEDNNMSSKQLTTARDILLGRDVVKPGVDDPDTNETDTPTTQANNNTANKVRSETPATYGNTQQPEQSYNATFETNKELTNLKQANVDLVLKYDAEHLRAVKLEGVIRGLKSNIEKLEEVATNDENIIFKLNDEIAKLQSALKASTKKPVKVKAPTYYKQGTVVEVLAKFLPDGVNNTNDMRSALSDGHRKSSGINGALKAGNVLGLNEYLQSLSAYEINQLIQIKKDEIRNKAKAKRLSRK